LLFKLQHKIEKNERQFAFKALTDDVYAVSSLLKVRHRSPSEIIADFIYEQLYLRELPEPVFKYALQDRIQHTGELCMTSSFSNGSN